MDKKQASKLLKQGILVQVTHNPEGSQSDISIYSTSNRTLSDNMPILNNMGFKIDSELSLSDSVEEQTVYVRRYSVDCRDCSMVKGAKENVEQVIESVLLGKMSNTRLNALAFHVNLSPLEINLVSALAVYENQLVSDFSETLVGRTLVKYSLITRNFVQFFQNKFDPKIKNRANVLKKNEESILNAIRAIQNITEDKVLNIMFKILKALTRTNLYLNGNFANTKAIALKTDVSQLKEYLSDVQPRIETFVYHPTLRGTHHRRTNISRGGLRWSDRHEDFRNEIRLLMRAQRQKNAIITPSGAKGGFVITDPDFKKEDFKKYYSMFINALLDVVDNRVDDQVVRNPKQVIYDEDDTYFVVAADKGTAAMSDTANEISKKRNFWLHDAFASGGSKGYNHKEMGITAKGSIKSVERFFIENKINFHEMPITVVGIGSPAGDVFGNGIQLSNQFKLVAAISSREIFIDPEPDPESSHKERQRLFDKGWGWDKYDPKKISEGGGIFQKREKVITVSKEIKRLLGIKKDIVNGEELTRAVLSAKVDLLFNGGVGTYVRGVNESNAEIGDKPNESVRITSKDVKASAICEGGNLGFTQKARIELAKRGIKVTTDSIDNSAGVQTSDYEVNLKIILNNLVQKNIIPEEKRLELLANIIPDVEKTVLHTNYMQALSLSLDEVRSIEETYKFKNTVLVLEDNVDSFNRTQFEIPGPDEFHTITTKDKSIARPILAILLSYSKIFLKSFLLAHEEFISGNFAQQYIYRYFPKAFSTLYKKEVENHPLRPQIVATHIANKIINYQGVTFISDFHHLGEEKFLLKIHAFLAINQLVSADDIRYEIFRQDYKVPAKKQYDLLLALDEAMTFLVDWILEHGEYKVALFDHLPEYKKAVHEFIEKIDEQYIKEFVPGNERVNRFFSMIDYVRMVLTILSVKESTHQEFEDVANLFFTATQDLQILFLTNHIKEINAENIWEDRLVVEMEKDVFETIFRIIEKIMRFKRTNESIKDAYQAFVEINKALYANYFEDVTQLKNTNTITMVHLSVVITSLKKIAFAHQ